MIRMQFSGKTVSVLLFRLRSIELSPSPQSGCSKGNLARVAGDCAKYQVCVDGHYEEYQCLQGLHWSRVRSLMSGE